MTNANMACWSEVTTTLNNWHDGGWNEPCRDLDDDAPAYNTADADADWRLHLGEGPYCIECDRTVTHEEIMTFGLVDHGPRGFCEKCFLAGHGEKYFTAADFKRFAVEAYS